MNTTNSSSSCNTVLSCIWDRLRRSGDEYADHKTATRSKCDVYNDKTTTLLSSLKKSLRSSCSGKRNNIKKGCNGRSRSSRGVLERVFFLKKKGGPAQSVATEVTEPIEDGDYDEDHYHDAFDGVCHARITVLKSCMKNNPNANNQNKSDVVDDNQQQVPTATVKFNPSITIRCYTPLIELLDWNFEEHRRLWWTEPELEDMVSTTFIMAYYHEEESNNNTNTSSNDNDNNQHNKKNENTTTNTNATTPSNDASLCGLEPYMNVEQRQTTITSSRRCVLNLQDQLRRRRERRHQLQQEGEEEEGELAYNDDRYRRRLHRDSVVIARAYIIESSESRSNAIRYGGGDIHNEV